MKAIELTALDGFDSLRLSEVDKPSPAPGEVLIKVRAAGINYAELEQTTGRYPLQRPLPAVLGFEAAGEVVELGSGVEDLTIGDTIAAPVLSGGYAEFATARADSALRIPEGIDFAQATSIVVQGLSAWALLKLAAKPTPSDTVLIQAAAGGVGLYLVQLAKALGWDKSSRWPVRQKNVTSSPNSVPTWPSTTPSKAGARRSWSAPTVGALTS